ncbi:MAG: SDR family NAD(P)-dependent oxidoreductase [Anaerolineae bacterium]|nr:SDR family NAD(P)-dependent oxidoreductase [Anaerolineae bacterium]MCI0607683.1 SDR family NAD(P)-dependent oxidoreductase [Anaerolineae bacterium]
MTNSSTQKVIVITGATGALGNKTAHTFAARGHSLTLIDTDQNKLDSLVRDLNLPDDRFLTLIADLRNGEAVRSAAEAVSAKFGRVDALIHLVGGWTGGKTLPEASAEDLESMLGQHVWTTFHLFQSFAPKLASNGWGRVIIVSASTVPNPPGKAAAYTAAKAAQENLVLTLSAELKDKGVTANIIQVKAIDVANKGTGTTPNEIVAAMLYLFSDEAAKLNGARVPLY